MSIFLGRQCAFVFPIYVRKYRKQTIDRWIVVYTVCASAVISPLRQWLDSYAKTRLKMSHTFKHLFKWYTFCCRLILLSLSLYIELALVCCMNNADLKLLENCVMNGFIIFGIMCMTATGLENSPQSFGVYTVSQSRSVVTSAENPAPDNSPQSIGELRNGHLAN